MPKIILDDKKLTIEDIINVARNDYEIELSEKAKEKIKKSRQLLEKWVNDGKVIYGVTTGFGALCKMLISPNKRTELQTNLIRSHAANVGEPFPREIVRATMLLRINSLSKGHSGIKLETLNAYIEMLNKGVHPAIPQMGSMGASGDLAPLAHIALALMGEGKVEYKGKILPAKEALNNAGIKPSKLDAKEGLALINGTSAMSALGVLIIHDTKNLIKTAEIASALSLEALKASSTPFDEKAQELKPHPGQIITAENLRKLLKGSKLITTNNEIGVVLEKQLSTKKDVTESEMSLQHAYTLRCIPQLLGSIRDAVKYAEERIITEANSCTDNPLIIDGKLFHGGHFHGQPVALPLDVLAIAITEIGLISERRINRFLDKDRSDGLPPFLIRKDVGLSAGFEGIQYTATSIVAENKSLCMPVSIQSIPSNAENQDVVSMGLVSARKTLKILKNTHYVVALELMCGVEAADFRNPDLLGTASEEAYKIVRTVFEPLKTDRFMTPELEKVTQLVEDNVFVTRIEKMIGKLK